jgi:hypothetical protein
MNRHARFHSGECNVLHQPKKDHEKCDDAPLPFERRPSIFLDGRSKQFAC